MPFQTRWIRGWRSVRLHEFRGVETKSRPSAHNADGGCRLSLRSQAILAGLTLFICLLGIGAGVPRLIADNSNARTISIYNIHTKDTVTVVYKRGGKYVPSGMREINWVMRDWRRDEPTTMDPKLIDILWEMHSELGSRKPIHLISGYRSQATNEKLRQMRGGQARKSRHILGKAADVHFPDVPIRRLRYSALVRQRGGVGYYPTSSLPFVHVDTGRVRHWPRMPRYELALLFPNGSTKHVPSDGRRITRADVRVARSKHKSLATQVAQFFAVRDGSPRPTLVAGVKRAQPPERSLRRVAALQPRPRFATPRLAAAPKPLVRPARFAPAPSNSDRAGLNKLIQLAAFTPEPIRPSRTKRPTLLQRPVPARPPSAGAPETAKKQLANEGLRATAALASVNPLAFIRKLAPAPSNETNAKKEIAVRPPLPTEGWSNGWAAAPAFDDEHPEELSYRPYPIASLLTASASGYDGQSMRLVAPDLTRTADLLFAGGTNVTMRFGPEHDVGERLLSQQFAGRSVERPTRKRFGRLQRRVRTTTQ